jgi:hypothetical protein
MKSDDFLIFRSTSDDGGACVESLKRVARALHRIGKSTMRLNEIRTSAQIRSASRAKLVVATMLLAILALSAEKANAQVTEEHPATSPEIKTFEPPTETELDKLGMQKLAEMTAMSRHNETCPTVPDEWSDAYLVLLMKNPPPEEEVEAQERKTLALRRRIGNAKWCELHSVEMQEAYLLLQLLMQRKSP